MLQQHLEPIRVLLRLRGDVPPQVRHIHPTPISDLVVGRVRRQTIAVTDQHMVILILTQAISKFRAVEKSKHLL